MPSQAIQVEIKSAIESFRFNSLGLKELLAGPVAKDLVRRAIRVEASAKYYATGQGGGPRVRTGRLRGSITWRLGVDALSPYADVGSAVLYAPYVELGTSRMPAYPYLRPALEAARATI
jgi:hypothetical protein